MPKNPLYVYSATGGGTRIGANFGAQLAGQFFNKWYPEKFDVITGNSSGALEAALTASGMSTEKKIQLFKDLDVPGLLSHFPWKLRLASALVNPVSMKRFAEKIDSWDLPSSSRCYINAWDSRANKQVIYCEKKPDWAVEPWTDTYWEEDAFNRIGWGKILTRSMALPGMKADELKYMDGGICEHPPLSFLPRDSHILLINLGYPDYEEGFERGMIARTTYAYSAIRKHLLDAAMGHFSDLHEIKTRVYNVSAYNFELSVKEKEQMIQNGKTLTMNQWANYQLPEWIDV